jgi:hypothetical protein
MRSTRRRSTSAKHPVAGGGGGREPSHQIAYVDEVGFQRGRSGVVPADLEQVDQERLEPLQLALQQLDGPAAGRGEFLPGLEEQVGGHLDGRQRGPELMADVRDELALHVGQVFELAELGLQAGRHVVERGGQRGQVVHTEHPHAFLEVAGRHALGRLGRLPDGQHHPPGYQRGDRGQQYDQRQPHADQDALDQQQGDLLLGEREHVVQLVVRPERHAHGQRRAVSARPGGIGQRGRFEPRGRGAVVVVAQVPLFDPHVADQVRRDRRRDDHVTLADPLHPARPAVG